MSLRLSKDLKLPLDAVTQTFGILAKRRAGKSYLAARLVEELWAARQQVVILDPKGDWWGLRSSADGKREGLPILILGGEHGDLKLEVGAGEVIARMIVEERVSALLDLSQFRKHEVATFSTTLLETLYRLKAREEYRTAMMLVIDEADAIAPQRPQRGEERMLGAAEDIIRRGGQRGIGCILATQRAAVLNKNVLTQIQILVTLRTIAPQDLAAMGAWIDVHGTTEQRHELMASLPALPTGTAWIWSPGWPTETGIFKRVAVSPRVTFDSGATPKPGETRIAPKTVAEVDLSAVQKRMAATIERAKSEDPRELRRRIVELQGTLARANVAAERIDKKLDRVKVKEKRVEIPVLKDAQIKRIEMALSRAEKFRDPLNLYLQKIDYVKAALSQVASEIMRSVNAVKDSHASPEVIHLPVRGTITARLKERTPSTPSSHPPSGETSTLGRTGQRILDALAWWDTIGVAEPDRYQVGAVAKINASGGYFDNTVGPLATAGYVARLAGRLTLTESGRALARWTERPPSLAEYHDLLRSKLTGATLRLLNVVIDERRELSREELGTAAGINPGGGYFDNSIGPLSTLGLVDRRQGKISPTKILFPDGLA